MKISERAYPFLKYIREHSSDFIGYPVHILTLPYLEAVDAAGPKLQELCVKEPQLYFNATGVFACKAFAYVYRFDEKGRCTISNIEVGTPVWSGQHVRHWLLGRNQLLCQAAPWLKREQSDLSEEISTAIDICAHLVVFQRFADLDTKHLAPGQRVVDIKCKYINETRVPVTIMDSTWFTNLVKSDAFKVRGHFRLQACGEAHRDRKLIWVNDFMKDGYTAPARKIKAAQ